MTEVVGIYAAVSVGWLIFLVVLALLVLLACDLRLGVLACYDETGPWVKVKVGPKYIQVFPLRKDPEAEAKKQKKKKAKAAKKAAKEAKKAQKPPKPKVKRPIGGLLELVWDLLPVVQNAASRFRHKLQIDDLTLDVTWAEEDPADAAIHYGYGWAAAEAILSFLEANFVIKNRQVAVSIDFLAEKPRVYIRAGLSLTLAQIMGIGLRTGVGAGKVLWHHRKTIIPPREPNEAQEKKGEANHGKQSSVE